MKLAVIDIETTGFYPPQDQILEVAAIEVDVLPGKLRILYEDFVNPDWPQDRLEAQAWPCQMGHIHPDSIISAPRARLVAEVLREALGDLLWTAFNKDFEYGFLSLPPWELPRPSLPCIMRASTPVCNIPHDYYGTKYPSLGEAFSIIVGGDSRQLHRARSDAAMAAAVLLKLVEMGHYKLEVRP